MNDTAHIAAETRVELRSILRQRDDLRKPLDAFGLVESRSEGEPRYYVLFDANPRLVVKGMRLGGCGTLRLTDERIIDQVYSFAESVWHFKDRLKLLARAARLSLSVESESQRSHHLMICSDLANWKKHGECRNRSGLLPRAATVAFDTSRSGPLELYYDGATKHQELLVTNSVPISYSVEVTGTKDGQEIALGDAVQLIDMGFHDWLPIVTASGVLSEQNRENEHLRQELELQATPVG